MAYFKEVRFDLEGREAVLWVTDDRVEAERLQKAGEAVLIYLHSGNSHQNFSHFLFATEEPEDLDPEYIEKVYRRLKGLSWNILETQRCFIRETTPEDVDDFYRIYSDPSITQYMEDLYPEKEREKAYICEYIEKIYTFYGYGVWTVVEKASGAVIGRAGISYREGYEDPELGFIIGVPWQRRGYALEVCQAILEYGWTEIGFERVQALVETENVPSLKICEKLGFHPGGQVTMKGRQYYLLLAKKEGRNGSDLGKTITEEN